VNKRIIPLSKRPGDIAILVFFFVNILLITYIVDIEQLIIADPLHFTYPIWPPPAAVDAIHWWGAYIRSGTIGATRVVEGHYLD
jgi:hypothetical protein